MNRFALASSLLVLTPLLAAGCIEVPLAILAADALSGGDEADDFGWIEADTGMYWEDGSSAPATGRMAGDMPQVAPFSGELLGSTIYTSSYSTDLDLHIENDGWAMLGGGFDPAALGEDGHAVLSAGEHWVIGCAGPSRYDFVVDEPADTVEITETPVQVDGQAMIELHIVATFGDGSVVDAVAVRPAPVPTPGDG